MVETLSKERKVPKGEVYIIVDRCKGCSFCIEFCPKKALVVSSEFNIKGYHPPRLIADDICINCRFCELICPEFAIFSLRKDQSGN
jgi:2-oxoglutarate ferredoxin oxidoreductase subunit delta